MTITQAQYDMHDCGTPSGDGCQACMEWFAQMEELTSKEPKGCIGCGLPAVTRCDNTMCDTCWEKENENPDENYA